jgi:hypothetical protein
MGTKANFGVPDGNEEEGGVSCAGKVAGDNRRTLITRQALMQELTVEISRRFSKHEDLCILFTSQCAATSCGIIMRVVMREQL